MKLDRIHDLQQVYRQLVGLTAAPGTVAELGAMAARIEPIPPLNPAVMLIALCLLDGEVSFACQGRSSGDDATRFISRITTSQAVPDTEADFVFVTADDERADQALRNARVGTLTDPHLGATVVLEVEELEADPPEGRPALTLRGPGIEVSRRLSGVWRPDWPTTRNVKTAEFPLGIDLFLVDRRGSTSALPRTTQMELGSGMEAGDASWAT